MTYNVFIVSILIICLVAVAFSGCLGPNSQKSTNLTQLPTSIQIPGEGGPNKTAEMSVVDANNKFALDFYSQLRKDPRYFNKTLFFSPFSISSALAITHEGARGSTANEIQSVFYFPNNSNQKRMGYQQLYAEINQKNSPYILKTANALWAYKSYPFLPDYVNTARVFYNANITNLDFKNEPDNSRIIINTWIEDQTEKKIKNLISSGEINPLTRLVITNAIYFKGNWALPFDKNETRDDIFNVEPGKYVQVQMMQKTDGEAIFNYTETDNLQVLELPYAKGSGKQISMLVLLPKMHDLKSVEESLSVEKLFELKHALKSQRVNVMFPKFNLETKYNLATNLASMGMPTAFTDQADFSGMDGMRNLYIGTVIHQAFVDVNEEGTEAAAATEVGIVAMSAKNEAPIPTYRADHPFILIIQDSDNGNILFMGRVNNPNS